VLFTLLLLALCALCSNRYKMLAHHESVKALPEYQLVEMMGRMADCDMLLMHTRPYEVSHCKFHSFVLMLQLLCSITCKKHKCSSFDRVA
jgi:hypothetical protein